MGFSIFIFGICSYFILIKANSLKLKKVTDDSYLNADEEIVWSLLQFNILILHKQVLILMGL